MHTFPCTSTPLQTWAPTYLVLTHLQVHTPPLTPRHLAPPGPHTGHTLAPTYLTPAPLAPSCLPLSPTELGTCTPTPGHLHTWASAHPRTPNSLPAPPPRLQPIPPAARHWTTQTHTQQSLSCGGTPPSPAHSRNPNLSELGSSFLLLHAAVGHEVVEYFSCRAEAKGVRVGCGGGAASRAGRGGDSPALAYSITRYSVFSVSITSKSFTATAGGGGGGELCRKGPRHPPTLEMVDVLSHDTPHSRALNGSLLMARFSAPQPHVTPFIYSLSQACQLRSMWPGICACFLHCYTPSTWHTAATQ